MKITFKTYRNIRCTEATNLVVCVQGQLSANVSRVVYSLFHDELAKIAGFNIMTGC